MNLFQAIEAFVKVAELGSYTRAAETMEQSRTMVSKHVMDLEDHLGVRLLNRTTRRLSLTEAGTNYLERARTLLTLLEEAQQEAGSLGARPRGRLRVNVPVAFGTRHVAPALGTYMDAYPEVDVELTLNDRVVDLVEEGYDMAIRIGRLADSSLVARRLAPCRVVVCAAPSYLERHGTPRHPEDLVGHNCLCYSYDPGRDEWSFEGPEGAVSVRVHGRMSSNNGEALTAAAVAGVGIIVKPTFIVGPALRAGQLVELMPGYRIPDLGMHAVYPGNRYVPAKVRTFIDHLAGMFGVRPPWEP